MADGSSVGTGVAPNSTDSDGVHVAQIIETTLDAKTSLSTDSPVHAQRFNHNEYYRSSPSLINVSELASLDPSAIGAASHPILCKSTPPFDPTVLFAKGGPSQGTVWE
ncbi:hypothetical protein DL93DRAFT_2084411 [Clavulina sp. PMI_390]|nr:hypothetical protein DL93DRAFT_2084411 [Clavulina sp. PMI_390]